MTSNRRTLVRAVAVSAAVSGALLAPAAVAFADSPAPAPSQSAPSTPSESKKDENKKSEKEQDAQEFKLSNNAVAHVYKLPKGGYMAWITMNGQRIANLSAENPTATVKGYKYELNQANGFVGVQHPGGWHSEQDKPKPNSDGKKKDDRRDGKTVTPKGGVKAGAEGVQEQNPAFLVAGGGMAAAGAAGLGYAILRRGRVKA
ncbi:hypothetical protein ACFYZ9_39990 [Streptomyces sp. NPDC001691]|uniref:hypothetical protein n=1 Tax=unclassified Streptomyces TaxID=2593676 RepID=UPI000DEA250C|nr:hypothetical protein [Streptomyces sp. SDr-06]RCH61627.1 hypothetical protein DT019_37200 [Streptomyces sp. SDr-06]